MRAFIFFIAALPLLVNASPGDPTPRQLAQFTVRDTVRHLEWLRCSAGQTWNGNTCAGEARLFTYEEAERAAALARAELGGTWRLPQRDELESLLCAQCEPPLIDSRTFPHTPGASFWSSTPNWFSASHHWSVNFRNGYGTARNPPGMRHYLRLVRDLPEH